MSLMTHVVVYGAQPRDVAHLNAWLAQNDERRQQLHRLDTDAAGGTKIFNKSLYAAAFNYAPEGLIEKLKDHRTWGDAALSVSCIVDGESLRETFMFKDVPTTGEVYCASSRMYTK